MNYWIKKRVGEVAKRFENLEFTARLIVTYNSIQENCVLNMIHVISLGQGNYALALEYNSIYEDKDNNELSLSYDMLTLNKYNFRPETSSISTKNFLIFNDIRSLILCIKILLIIDKRVLEILSDLQNLMNIKFEPHGKIPQQLNLGYVNPFPKNKPLVIMYGKPLFGGANISKDKFVTELKGCKPKCVFDRSIFTDEVEKFISDHSGPVLLSSEHTEHLSKYANRKTRANKPNPQSAI